MSKKDSTRIDRETLSRLIPGIHPVREALLHGRARIAELWVAAEKRGERVEEVIRIAQEKGVPVSFKEAGTLDGIFPDVAHQGVVALAGEFRYSDLEELIGPSLKAHGGTVILALDHITDEGNLGALVRTGAFFGANGLILPKDRSAKITGRVLKSSAGAFVHLPVARVVNLARALDLLRKRGLWIIGTAGEASESIYQCDWKRDVVLILGREDRGLSHGIRGRCDQVVAIPRIGNVDSLNVSVAAGIILSEMARQRNKGE